MTQDRKTMNKNIKRRKPGKRSSEESKKTKEAVIKAALKIFAKEGFYHTTFREITDLAGTTHGIITHYFGSKYELYKTVLDYGLNIHTKRLRRVAKLHKSDDPVALFKDLIASYVATVAKNPEVSKIIMDNESATSPLYEYLQSKKQLRPIAEPIFSKVQKCGYFKEFKHDNFVVYLQALIEIPILMADRTNRLMGVNILSRRGIALHTEQVLKFLFP